MAARSRVGVWQRVVFDCSRGVNTVGTVLT